MSLETALLAAIASLVSVIAILWRELQVRDRRIQQREAEIRSEARARARDSTMFLSALEQLRAKSSAPPRRDTPTDTPEARSRTTTTTTRRA